MQIFSKNIIDRPTFSGIKDRYEVQVQTAKNKVITMENLNLTEYSTSKEAIQYYYRGVTLGIIGLLTSAISYPLSVRLVKRVFGIKNFLNIHMAAIPIIININAFVLGITQGGINYYFLSNKYLQKEQGRYFKEKL